MKLFFDTSAFAKRYVTENGTSRVLELCQKANAIGLAVGLFARADIGALPTRARKQVNAVSVCSAEKRPPCGYRRCRRLSGDRLSTRSHN